MVGRADRSPSSYAFASKVTQWTSSSSALEHSSAKGFSSMAIERVGVGREQRRLETPSRVTCRRQGQKWDGEQASQGREGRPTWQYPISLSQPPSSHFHHDGF